MATRQKTFYRLYTLVMIVFVVVVVEILSGAILKAKDQGSSFATGSRHLFHPYRSHQLNPQYVRQGDTLGQKIHSEDGFRSDGVFSKNKPDDVYRIIFLGGSAAYGIGATAPYPEHPSLSNTETVSYFIEQQLQAKAREAGSGKRIEVINAAVTAYTTFHHLVYFNEVLYEYEPDLLVFMDGHNDFYNYRVFNNWQSYNSGTVLVTEDFNQRGSGFTTLTLVRYFARYSRFFRVVERYMQRRWITDTDPEFVQEAYAREVPTEFPSNVDQVLRDGIFKTYVQFQALSTLFDFEMMVFLQPQVALENTADLSETDKSIQSITAQYENNPRRAEIRPYFRDQFSRYGINYHDVAQIASDKTLQEQLYIDYCHLSPAGARVTATRMVPSILDQMLAAD